MDAIARSPRYWLRRHLAVRTLRRFTPGSLIEIGCGTGELIPSLAGLGFHGVGLEISTEIADIARRTIEPVGDRFEIITDPSHIRDRRFEYACAFEVLEHIENDLDLLTEWTGYLSPGGVFLASVPAHMKLWTGADEAVGHYRRYEADQLVELFTRAGITVSEVWSYGFPLTSFTRLLRRAHALVIAPPDDQDERTLRSAVASTAHVPRFLELVSRSVGVAGHIAQLPFLKTDLGDGYFLVGRREVS